MVLTHKRSKNDMYLQNYEHEEWKILHRAERKCEFRLSVLNEEDLDYSKSLTSS